MTQIAASLVGGRTETHGAGAMNRVGHGRFGAGASGRSEVRRCLLYGSASRDHLVEGASANEAQVVGLA